MTDELRTWFDALRLGSTTTPAVPTTGRVHGASTDPLRTSGGPRVGRCESRVAREITREHVKRALPDHSSDRGLIGQALRSFVPCSRHGASSSSTRQLASAPGLRRHASHYQFD